MPAALSIPAVDIVKVRLVQDRRGLPAESPAGDVDAFKDECASDTL